ncbi:MAG: hypothetical protein J5825_09620 [Lachnospiraceae bacterium]|nr:hypothetical protein [Lachnospiraceae bacterium]
MRRFKGKVKKHLAILLSAAMLLGAVPVSALAGTTGAIAAEDQEYEEPVTGSDEDREYEEPVTGSDEDQENPTEPETVSEETTVEKDPEETVLALRSSSEDAVRSEDSDALFLTGMMPADAVVDVQPVDVDINGQAALLAYDITLYADSDQRNKGNEWQPDADPVTVHLSVDTPSEMVDIYHFSDINATPEYVGTFPVVDGKVVFDAQSFSVYAVIDHEDGIVVNPRVMFHFISDGAAEHNDSSNVYYEGTPFTFLNKSEHHETHLQTSQILSNGEALELIADPGNQQTKFFYGWYTVDPHAISGTTNEYGLSNTDDHLFFTWPASPKAVAFESPISITESNVAIGSTVHWQIENVSGSGTVDSDGNVHVFLAPIFEKYNFVNYMLYPRSEQNTGAANVMTRKLIARGSSENVDVKISDIRATSSDPVHLVFTGWEYEDRNHNWHFKQTVDYTGAELKETGKDGVYLSINLEDTSSVDLYPVFVEARWTDFFSGVSGSGATYVSSRFRESWGTPENPLTGMTEDPDRNVFTVLECSTRAGYHFEGWYAFAVTDPQSGEITNLTTPADVTVTYIDTTQKFKTKTITINTTAIKIAEADGSVCYSGMLRLTDNGNGTGSIDNSGTITLFESDGVNLKLYDALDRMKLTANWTPDNSQFTIVYWTENAQGKDYTAPANAKDDYSTSSVKVVTTAELNSQLGTSYASGSTITREQIDEYLDNSVSVLSHFYLDEVGAVLSGEDKFYELNSDLSDASVTIKGDGSSVINVFYSRRTFKLVFHIGRDGYVKQNGQQKPEMMKDYPDWDGNWIQFMFDDSKVTSAPPAGLGYTKGPTAKSYAAHFTMSYNGRTYTSDYVTTRDNVKGDYVPADNEDVYVITAKYGAYIGERWPTPVNQAFTFSHDSTKSMYIWAAYYGSRYCKLANDRGAGSGTGNNPDINGIYEYMSAELCSNREGTEIINSNQVLHLVAYYGDTGKAGIQKHYHLYYEAIDGTYDPDAVTLEAGHDYLGYTQTTWSTANGSNQAINGHSFYHVLDTDVISNLEPRYQLGTNLDGYDLVYSCYDTPSANNHHIYFFYRPKQYSLIFDFGNTTQVDQYFYTQSLANADKYSDQVIVPEGYSFMGWYTNTEGVGEPFDFANEKMGSDNIVLYPIVKVLQYPVKIDPNGGVIDHRTNTSQSTYFTADYGTTVGEYSTTRDYIILTDKEMDPSNTDYYYAGTKYYYINTQWLELPSEGEWGLPTDLRNSVYVAEDQIDAYYDWYCSIIDSADSTWWTGIQKLSKADFLATYTSTWYRPLSGSEHYTFMGWYQVFADGSVDSMPYNFNNPVTGPLELRALWRLDGGYYIHYNPAFYTTDSQGHTILIIGEMDSWNDPDNPSVELYADQAPTHIYRAPTNIKTDWVFRGWRIVRNNGTANGIDEHGNPVTYTVWEPIQRDSNSQPIYYQPGDYFRIDSMYVTDRDTLGNIIHMQAYYEPLADSFRKPEITALTLDANDTHGGYIGSSDSSDLPSLNGLGRESINTSTELDASDRPTQILFGDLQSNLALHLYKYATEKTIGGQTGTGLFKNDAAFFLIGFDESEDPFTPSTGDPFVPAYAPDSVVAVTRNETNRILYAMWEPMIYVTFINTTDAPITVLLSGNGTDTVRIVNEVTGEYDREKTGQTIVIPARSGNEDGELKIVLPKANTLSSDIFDATVTNDHPNKRISVSGSYHGTTYGTGEEKIPYGYNVDYTAQLQQDHDGIVVTYTEEDDLQIDFDVNGGIWQETSSDYEHVEGDLYTIHKNEIEANGGNYKPANPTFTGNRIFIGWTENKDIANNHDFSLTHDVTLGETRIFLTGYPNVYEKVKNDYLYDFSIQPPPYGIILYAVYCDYVEVTFDLQKTGSTLHTWTGPATTDIDDLHVFYRESPTSQYVTYKLISGNKVPKPEDPAPNGMEWNFIFWLKGTTSTGYTNNAKSPNDSVIQQNKYDFSQPVTEDINLYTSWMNQYVTITFDLLKNGSDLHNWTGPETTDTPALHVFYRNPANSRYVSYKMLGGETVPTPEDPTSYGEDWVFLYWLKGTTSPGYTNAIKKSSDSDIQQNKYDFTQPVYFDTNLYTSWMNPYVTVTFDLQCSGSSHHIWTEQETSNTPGIHVFYRDPLDDRYVYYKMLAGETVPVPSDPQADSSHTNWYFIKWLESNNTTSAYKNKTVDNLGENTDLTKYAFDFSKSVMTDVTLVTSWTSRVPQVFTFTVENKVSGGNPNDDFEYTIAVSNEKVDKSNKLTAVDNPWGTVTTNLKNNECYTVRITVRTIYAWSSNDNFGGTIEVIDRNGNVVKSKEFNKLSSLSQKFYSSNYQFDLSITQTKKTDYETTVEVKNNTNSVVCSADTEATQFSFSIRQGTKYYDTQINPYVSGANNNLSVIFTNTGEASEVLIAPTNVPMSATPFYILEMTGIALLSGTAAAGIYRKRKRRSRISLEQE